MNNGNEVNGGTFNLIKVIRFFEENGDIREDVLFEGSDDEPVVTKVADFENPKKIGLFEYPIDTDALRIVVFFDPTPDDDSDNRVACFDV